MAITDWPAQGAAALTDAELLAIFLRVGMKGKSAVDLARELIQHFGSLNRLFSATRDDLSAISGMGPAKYAQLQAVLEMSRRALAEEMKRSNAFSTPAAVRDYLRLHLAGLAHEVFLALWLDAQNCLIAAEELFHGTVPSLRLGEVQHHIARFGGDEFVVLVSELMVDRADSTAQAKRIAEKIRSALSQAYLLTIQRENDAATTVEHHCTVSIGVALFINHEASQDDILKWADKTMYQAKDAGRNQIRFHAVQ